MEERPIVVVSNRGPVSFTAAADGTLVARPGAGGLASGLAAVAATTDVLWIAAALSEGDRLAASEGPSETGRIRVRLLALDPHEFRMAYDVVCNGTLWFAHHGLFDLTNRPCFDDRWHAAWDAYRSTNVAFADAIAESAPPDAAVLVQDYHLCLVGPLLAATRPDLATVHFSHTPFAGPDGIRVLPTDARRELLEGLAGHGSCGFHSTRWAAAFSSSCEQELGRTPSTFVAPLAPDAAALAATASSAPCVEEFERLDQSVGDRRFLVRVDRIELSKNLVRGFLAYDRLLAQRPEWRERVVFGAFLYPSRQGLPEYIAYRQQVEQVVRRTNERWSTPAWTPIALEIDDNYERSIAALRRADVLVVNPLRDGLNLVAKEGALVNERNAPLLLSPEAGAWDELAEAALMVEPFDIDQTARTMHDALSLDDRARDERATTLRRVAGARTPADWLRDLRRAAG